MANLHPRAMYGTGQLASKDRMSLLAAAADLTASALRNADVLAVRSADLKAVQALMRM